MDVPGGYKRYVGNPGSFAFPPRVTAELSDRCDLACPMCPRSCRKGGGLMEWRLYERIVDEVSRHPGTALVPFFRGESMMHPRFLEAMRLAKAKGIAPVQLMTNATLLTTGMSKALVDLPVDFISFSLDAVSKVVYERQRKGASYEAVMANVEGFLSLRAKRKGRLPEVQVSAVETEATKGEIPAFIEFWRPRVDRVRIYEEHSQGGVFGSLPGPAGPRKPCGKPLSDLVVCWDGKVALCNHDWERREPLGDVNRQSIEEIWRSAAYHKVRMAHLEGHAQDDPSCRGCSHWAQYYRPGGIIGRLVEGTPGWRV